MSRPTRGMCQRMDRSKAKNLPALPARDLDSHRHHPQTTEGSAMTGIRFHNPSSRSLYRWLPSTSIPVHVPSFFAGYFPTSKRSLATSFTHFRSQLPQASHSHSANWPNRTTGSLQKIQFRPCPDFVQPEFSTTRPPTLR